VKLRSWGQLVFNLAIPMGEPHARASRMPLKRLQCESGSAWSFYLRDLSDRATAPVDGWFAIATLPSCITDAGDRTLPVRLFAAASSLGCSLSVRVTACSAHDDAE